MKEKIHPQWYPEARVSCACGVTWTVGATVPEIRTDICSSCHPFYTGEMRIVDTEGQVDRFMKRLQARDRMRTEASERAEAQPTLETPISDLDLSTRPIKALNEAGLNTVGDILDRLAQGDAALLEVQGFGRKALIDTKKALRTLGYDIPEAEPAA